MALDDKIVMLYVPCGSEEEAARIITALLDERLVACGNILPSQSFYTYEGKTVNEMELILICKTNRDNAHLAQERIIQLHSYEVPCVITIETATANHSYASWLKTQVAQLPGVTTQNSANRSEVAR